MDFVKLVKLKNKLRKAKEFIVRILVIFALSVQIVSCGSTGVVPVDRDSYMIGRKDSSPGLGISISNKAQVYREANEFCAGKGMQVETLNLSVIPSDFAKFGSTELRFKCIAGETSAVPHVREPDKIIELRNR